MWMKARSVPTPFPNTTLALRQCVPANTVAERCELGGQDGDGLAKAKEGEGATDLTGTTRAIHLIADSPDS